MSRKQIKGFVLHSEGIIAPNQPMRASVNVPKSAVLHELILDGNGSFIQLAEVESVQEGQKVTFKEVRYVIVPTNFDIPNGLTYVKTLQHGPAVFHVFTSSAPRVIV